MTDFFRRDFLKFFHPGQTGNNLVIVDGVSVTPSYRDLSLWSPTYNDINSLYFLEIISGEVSKARK